MGTINAVDKRLRRLCSHSESKTVSVTVKIVAVNIASTQTVCVQTVIIYVALPIEGLWFMCEVMS